MNNEEGSGTLVTLAVIVTVCVLAICVLIFSVALSVGARTQGIADMSALAAGEVSAIGKWSPSKNATCERAKQVATMNGAELVSCDVHGSDAYIVVGVQVSILHIPIDIERHARAGPANAIGANFH